MHDISSKYKNAYIPPPNLSIKQECLYLSWSVAGSKNICKL